MGIQVDKLNERTNALDELFEASASYKSSQNYFKHLQFISNFYKLSPFNAFLIHMQNNGVEIVMSAAKWKKYGRDVKYNSRPLVILVPFGPVEFVYDVADTEGDPVPDELINPFHTTGEVPYDVYGRTIHNCARDFVNYAEDEMHKSAAGYATTKENKVFKVVVNKTYTISNKYSTFVHELGHIYAGHLGGIESSWWRARPALSHSIVQVEAESISYLVCKRMGLKTSSESYLSNYIEDNKDMPAISLDVIFAVAGYIEQLGQPNFRPKKSYR